MRRQAAARAAGAVPAPGAAALCPAVAGEPGRRPEHRRRPGHLHDEVQPQDQRPTGRLAQDGRPAPAAGRGRRCRASWRSCTALSRSSKRSRAWTASRCSRAPVRRPSIPTSSIIRAYHEARGEAEQRDEIITTIFSHPSNAACAQTAGFKVITLYPDEDGYPDLEALQGRRLGADGGADDHQSGGHGHLQPPDRRVCAGGPRGGRAVRLRPGQRQRHPGHHPGPGGRL